MAQAAWPGWAEAKDAGQQTLETLGGGIETLQQAPKGGLTPLGLIAVFSPVLLYGVFSIIRTTLNPRLKVPSLPPFPQCTCHNEGGLCRLWCISART